MIPASSDYRAQIRNGRITARASVTLADGTGVAFAPDEIVQGGLSIARASSSSGTFDIGAAIIGKCRIRVTNEDRRWDLTDFGGARMLVYVGAPLGGAVQWELMGTYTVEPVHEIGDILSLTASDNLSRLEVPYSRVLTEYPATLKTIAKDICATCGVPMASQTFHGCDVVVDARRADSKASCIEVLSWVAQASGNFVDCDPEGRVRIRWYDFGAFDASDELDGGGFHAEADDADGGGFHAEADADHSGGPFGDPLGNADIRSLRAAAWPVRITGVAVTAADDGDMQGEQELSGADGYVLNVNGNPLVTYGTAGDVARGLHDRVRDLALRDVSATVVGDPTVEAGDPVVVTDRHGVTYRFWATQVTWSSAGSLTVACGVAESSPLKRVERRSRQQTSTDTALESIKGRLDGLSGTIDQIMGGGAIDFSELTGEIATLQVDLGKIADDYDDRIQALENRTSVGQWTIQVDGVAQATGTLNFVTQSSGS